MNVDNLSVEELIELRAHVDALLKQKVADQQKELARQLRILEGIDAAPSRRGVAKGTKVAPKYRGPNGETWAGRGARPKWLVAGLKRRGAKLEDFLI